MGFILLKGREKVNFSHIQNKQKNFKLSTLKNLTNIKGLKTTMILLPNLIDQIEEATGARQKWRPIVQNY